MEPKPRSKWRIFLWLLAIALIIFGLARIYYRATDDFRLANMTYDMPYEPSWDIPTLPQSEKQSLDQILGQKFYYIGKGAQSYAFSSEDGNYVLKFFKFKHLKPSAALSLIPSIGPLGDYKTRQELRKKKKLEGVFTGYRLAYEVHKKDSGLLFIHLNRTKNFNQIATVYDKLGFEHRIDLDPIVFVVQQKAKTTRAVVIDFLKQGNLAQVKRHIGLIFDLYVSEYQKGIYDKDHGVMHNTGFVAGKPIHLDVGKLTQDESMKRPEVWQQDLQLIGRKFTTWLSRNYPEQYEELAQDMEARLSQIFGHPFHFNP